MCIALKIDGVFKYGKFEGIQNGRYYTDFTEGSLGLELLKTEIPSFRIIGIRFTHDVRPDREEERWINLLARRV